MTTRTTADLTTIGNADQITITPTRGAPTMTDTTDNQPSGAQRMFGDFAPGLVGFTDDVLFGQVCTRPDLSLHGGQGGIPCHSDVGTAA